MTEYSQPGDMMVVSAAGSTTNQLISWLKLSQTDRLSAHQVQQSLRRYQSELIAGLLPADVADGLITAPSRMTLSVWQPCWTAGLPTRCMPKWWATVKCGPRA